MGDGRGVEEFRRARILRPGLSGHQKDTASEGRVLVSARLPQCASGAIFFLAPLRSSPLPPEAPCLARKL